MMAGIGYIVLISAYGVALLWLASAWMSIPEEKSVSSSAHHFFSLVIPFRNECKALPELIKSLQQLDYPYDHFEILLVDDASDDESNALAQAMAASLPSMQVLFNNQSPGKKGALATGISVAKHEYILTIDADCIVPATLLYAYNQHLQEHGSDMVLGPVLYMSYGAGDYLNYELAALVGLAGASLYRKQPTTANGANLCFRKTTFAKVGGYQSHVTRASGDDEFLLHQIIRDGGSVSFLKSRAAIVYTQPPCSVMELVRQRIRWSSKFKAGHTQRNAAAPVLLWVMYALQIGLLLVPAAHAYVLVGLLMKVVAEAFFMLAVLPFFHRSKWVILLPLMQVVYPVYILVIGLFTLASPSYIWKNRRVQ